MGRAAGDRWCTCSPTTGTARWSSRRCWPRDQVRPVLPFTVADYVDFYSSQQHATNIGRIFRPDSPALPPNWKHLPIGYHGRAGTVAVSGTEVIRPRGQRRPPDAGSPTYGPSARLDIEAEVGFVVGVPSTLGTPVPPTEWRQHVFGVLLVNDWSARDVQAWEYQPLGPFLGKSFLTSVSPWVVPLAALEDAFVEPPAQYPRPLDYLLPAGPGLALELEVRLNGQRRVPAAGGGALLDGGPAARAPDRERCLAADRRPVRLRHRVRGRGGPARLADRADLERRRAARAWPAATPAPSCGTVTRSRSRPPRRARPASRIGFGEVTGTVVPG